MALPEAIIHQPVMKQEVLEYLMPRNDRGLVIDCTLGEGGHSEAFLSQSEGIRVIGIDRDETIQRKAKNRLAAYGERVELVNSWFDTFLEEYGDQRERPAAVLFDFGISVYHYEQSSRGFSFRKDEPLDMRLDQDGALAASDIVNTYPQERLADVIFQYGEERYSRRIAAAVVEHRKREWIRSSKELADIIFHAVPKNYRHGRIHPATRTFQALRIEVNGELDRIQRSLQAAVDILEPGGRIGVISFHSLEDRIVKHTFKRLAKGCHCPPEQAECTCDGQPCVKILTKRPLTASHEEVRSNPPSRSAKFRCAQKVGAEDSI
jgi:16S rRNA (cytosine1402-N4)-methyltransferase